MASWQWARSSSSSRRWRFFWFLTTATAVTLLTRSSSLGTSRSAKAERRGAFQAFATAVQSSPGPTASSADPSGRFWTTEVTRIGPPLPEDADLLVDTDARWSAGVGDLRAACYLPDRVSATKLCEETLCIATYGGLVRSVDVESGSVVGDYYVNSHLAPSPIRALHFDGEAVVAGNEAGRVYVWRAELPGSWGFSHEPDWQMVQQEVGAKRAHGAAVTSISLTSGGSLVTGSADGSVIFWEPFGQESIVKPASILRPGDGVAVTCLCRDGDANVFYAGLADGRLFSIQEASKKSKKGHTAKNVLEVGSGIRSLLWIAKDDGLLLGLEDGSIQRWQPGGKKAVSFMKLHGDAVKSLSLAGSASSRVVLSTGADGRVGVWNLADNSPLWGFSNLAPDGLSACGDETRLLCSGVLIHASPRPERLRGEMSFSWKDPSPTRSQAPHCEALLCYDFLAGRRSFEQRSKIDFWPSKEEFETMEARFKSLY